MDQLRNCQAALDDGSDGIHELWWQWPWWSPPRPKRSPPWALNTALAPHFSAAARISGGFRSGRLCIRRVLEKKTPSKMPGYRDIWPDVVHGLNNSPNYFDSVPLTGSVTDGRTVRDPELAKRVASQESRWARSWAMTVFTTRSLVLFWRGWGLLTVFRSDFCAHEQGSRQKETTTI